MAFVQVLHQPKHARIMDEIFPSWPPPPAGLRERIRSTISYEKQPKE